jgi:hypothetical protein
VNHLELQVSTDFGGVKIPYHLNDPNRGAGSNGASGLKTLWLLGRQQSPEVQLASEPVAYPMTSVLEKGSRLVCEKRTRV